MPDSGLRDGNSGAERPHEAEHEELVPVPGKEYADAGSDKVPENNDKPLKKTFFHVRIDNVGGDVCIVVSSVCAPHKIKPEGQQTDPFLEAVEVAADDIARKLGGRWDDKQEKGAGNIDDEKKEEEPVVEKKDDDVPAELEEKPKK